MRLECGGGEGGVGMRDEGGKEHTIATEFGTVIALVPIKWVV